MPDDRREAQRPYFDGRDRLRDWNRDDYRYRRPIRYPFRFFYPPFPYFFLFPPFRRGRDFRRR